MKNEYNWVGFLVHKIWLTNLKVFWWNFLLILNLLFLKSILFAIKCLHWYFFSSNTTPTSPLLEEAGCGLLNALGSSSSPTFSSSLKLLVGSRHHFDLVSIDLSQNGNSDSTRILTLASGSSTGAISATEVSKFTWYYTSKY